MKTLIFIILWLILGITGIGLGVWQMERLAWKTAWLHQIEAAYQQPILTWPEEKTAVPATFFKRGTARISYNPQGYFFMRPHIYQGAFGGYLYQQARIDGAHTIWVNRGFVRDGWERLPLTTDRLTQTIQLRAMPLTTQEILAQNDHLTAADLKNLGSILAVVEPHNPNDQSEPIAIGARPNPANNHLYYALFWWGMGLAALAFGIIGWRRQHPFVPKAI